MIKYMHHHAQPWEGSAASKTKLNVQPKPTVAPQSLALAISGLTAPFIAAALASITSVAIQFVDIIGTLWEGKKMLSHFGLQILNV